ncbi:O-methyltransferase [Neobacillus sp. D3-1R]|uniref:O-methyltransferase n=1 Tax=Neobacillus sp. D3-1R TaxID=3445778 RepID=UPI003FA119F6
MERTIESLLNELELFGIENDKVETESRFRMKNITKDTGEFLSILIKSSRAKKVLEVGTSNGYSTIWLAQNFIGTDGHVTTLEFDNQKAKMAEANFAKAHLDEYITLHVGDAGEFLKEQDEATYDFIFLDSDRSQYMNWWNDLDRVLKPRSLMVIDNVISHRTEVEDFMSVINRSENYSSMVVPVGKGQLMVYKN